MSRGVFNGVQRQDLWDKTSSLGGEGRGEGERFL
jgi:hypothetical protein